MNTKIKICGITSAEDAKLALSLGADFIGFIFHTASVRHISYAQAADIMKACDYPRAIGIFIDQATEEIKEMAQTLKLWGVQIYKGHKFSSLPANVIHVIRVKDEYDINKIAVLKKDYPNDYILLDTYHPAQLGGSGKSFDWNLLPADLDRCFLSGGINSTNVKEALDKHPFAIDLASGVESSPGKKDPNKLSQFFNEVHHEK